MKDEMLSLYLSLKKTRKNCPWAKEMTLLEQAEDLEKEIEEIRQAIRNNDPQNLKEEIGDVFMDALTLLVIAEDMGIDSKDAVKKVREKLERRKPWVFGNAKVNTKEEAIKMWNEIKRKEKDNSSK